MTASSDFLLFTEALRDSSGHLMWRMLLLEAGSDRTITASDQVEEDSACRAELLAVVRGLEALDGPANVRLFTSREYIARGLSRELPHWRAQRWHWERFGRRVPIRDSDLWQRVDRALEFHSVECRAWGDLAMQQSEAHCVAPSETALEDAASASGIATHSGTPLMQDEAVLVVPKRRRRRTSGVAAATRNTIDGIRRGVESLMEPALQPVG